MLSSYALSSLRNRFVRQLRRVVSAIFDEKSFWPEALIDFFNRVFVDAQRTDSSALEELEVLLVKAESVGEMSPARVTRARKLIRLFAYFYRGLSKLLGAVSVWDLINEPVKPVPPLPEPEKKEPPLGPRLSKKKRTEKGNT